MRLTGSKSRLITKIGTSLIATLVALAVFALPAEARNHAPHIGDQEDHIPYFRTGAGFKIGLNCGFWGCRGHYWRAVGRFTAEYYFGDVQGTFKFSRVIPKPDRGGLSGRVKWSVYEKRVNDSSYRLVKTFYPGSQRGREGRRWTYGNRLPLDGQVKIVARANTVQGQFGTVGLKSVRLEYVDLHPVHISKAKILCLDDAQTQFDTDAVMWRALDRITPRVPSMNNPIMEYLLNFLSIIDPTQIASVISLADTLDDLGSQLSAGTETSAYMARLLRAAERCDQFDVSKATDWRVTAPSHWDGYGDWAKRIAAKTYSAYEKRWPDRHWCARAGDRVSSMFSTDGRFRVCFARAGVA